MGKDEDRAESARIEALKHGDAEIAYPGLDTDTLVIVESVEESPAIEWISIPKGEIPELVRRYTEAIEANPKGFCGCAWIQRAEKDGGGLVRIDENEDCIMHNRRGLIQGFFVWVDRYGDS